MSIIVDFFTAPDDNAAAGVVDGGPAGRFETVKYGNFIPDLALMEWEAVFSGGSLEGALAGGAPRIVAGRGQGSVAAVIAFPAGLAAALAAADEPWLAEAAARWAQLRAENGEELDPLLAGEILSEVAGLASSAAERGHQVYFWRC